MATLVFFGPLVELTRCRRDELGGRTVAEIVEGAINRYGDGFAAALSSCAIWVDGEPALPADEVPEQCEIAFLPPVSGGCGGH